MAVTETRPPVDLESREWVGDLDAGGATAAAAVARLHALLLRAARFEVARRSGGRPVDRDADEVALAAADAALAGVRARLGEFRGDSRFTTWACKFAVLEAGVRLRRRAWHGRELPATPVAAGLFTDLDPDVAAEQRELLDTVRDGIARLAPQRRDVLVALAVNRVPIDVLAERLGTTRAALYQTLHDARAELRRHLAAAGSH